MKTTRPSSQAVKMLKLEKDISNEGDIWIIKKLAIKNTERERILLRKDLNIDWIITLVTTILKV